MHGMTTVPGSPLAATTTKAREPQCGPRSELKIWLGDRKFSQCSHSGWAMVAVGQAGASGRALGLHSLGGRQEGKAGMR